MFDEVALMFKPDTYEAVTGPIVLALLTPTGPEKVPLIWYAPATVEQMVVATTRR